MNKSERITMILLRQRDVAYGAQWSFPRLHLWNHFGIISNSPTEHRPLLFSPWDCHPHELYLHSSNHLGNKIRFGRHGAPPSLKRALQGECPDSCSSAEPITVHAEALSQR